MSGPSTETLDRLYLEWSQFTQAKTRREIELEGVLARLLRNLDGKTADCVDNDGKLYQSQDLADAIEAGRTALAQNKGGEDD